MWGIGGPAGISGSGLSWVIGQNSQLIVKITAIRCSPGHSGAAVQAAGRKDNWSGDNIAYPFQMGCGSVSAAGYAVARSLKASSAEPGRQIDGVIRFWRLKKDDGRDVRLGNPVPTNQPLDFDAAVSSTQMLQVTAPLHPRPTADRPFLRDASLVETITVLSPAAVT